jgi:hypothetical protein
MTRYIVRLAVILGLVIGTLPLTFNTAEAHSFDFGPFDRTWARTDLPVAQGRVNRTWMWGPSGHSPVFEEPYHDAPGGTRMVQYTDKSRMEDNTHNAGPPWDVTNGLLATELITGRMQIGDANHQQREPAEVQVAGDSHPDSPTYATFSGVLDYDPVPTGWTIIQTINRNGDVGENSGLGQHGVTAEYHVSQTNHTVASVFWDFMNSSGQVYENGQFVNAQLFENPFFATGFPITEAYWMHVPVGGQWTDVLAQCFERRCLTYTPGNSAGWQVEAGNIGQHYYLWRYGDSPPAPAPPQPGDDPDELAYVDEILELLELTILSFELFDYLVANPTGTAEWFEGFDLVILTWVILHPELDSLNPPPAYEAFHNSLLNAYWTLGDAAVDINNGVYSQNEGLLVQGFNKLDTFVVQFEQAMMQFPQDEPGWASFESLNQEAMHMPALEALIESGSPAELLELVD